MQAARLLGKGRFFIRLLKGEFMKKFFVLILMALIYSNQCFSAVVEDGTAASSQQDVDTNGNAHVVLPSTATQAGFAQLTYNPNSSISKSVKVADDNSAYVAVGRTLFDYSFNTTSTAFNPVWGTNATTMTAVSTANYMRLNNSAITTTTTGVSMYTQRVFKLENNGDLVVEFTIKTTNATASSKQAEFGLGYYAFGTGQAAQMNEFIGFRWTTSGGLQGILSESTGGAPAEQTLSVNSNAPYADSVFRKYKVVISETTVEFWSGGNGSTASTLQGTLSRSNDNGGILKSVAYPIIMRVFNSGAASAAATYDINEVSVNKYGGEEDLPQQYRQALSDKSSFNAQPDLIVASTNPHNVPASGTAPTLAAGSNTASVLNNTAQMGGFYQMNATSISATVQSNIIVAAYQNPVIPTAAGAALNSRNFIATGISISPQVVSTVIVGGGYVGEWFVGIGGTATSLATADANGTTAVAQKASRIVPLSTVDACAAAAAVATVCTRTGDSTTQFTTPLVVHPGEFLHIGIRELQVTAAGTSGAYSGGTYVHGYWE
jgi:hypothetical protein